MIRVETAVKGEITANTDEVLRYLGYGRQKPDETVLKRIENCITVMTEALSCKACFDSFALTEKGGFLCIGEVKTNSESLKKHLADCQEAIVFTATLGMETERILQKYSLTSATDAAICQAVGAALIEEWCDELCRHFAEQTAGKTKSRFSAGYGDLPLEVQKDIFSMLDCPRKIGVTLTDSLLMLPSKSVSAIVGIQK